MALMGLDVGTTGCKAVVFGEEGAVLSRAYREYPQEFPRPGWAEVDPEVVWRRVAETIAEAAAGAGQPVTALCPASMGEAFVALDRAGRPLRPVIMSHDTRAAEQARRLAAQLGRERVFQITGQPIHSSYSLCKFLWMREVEPHLYRAVWKFLLFEDYVLHRLGAEPAIDYSLAARTLCLDVRRQAWSEEILSAVEVDPGLLARPVAAGTILGRVSRAVAAPAGLPPDCLLVAGGHDQPMCALGAGAFESGVACDSIGTVECVTNTHDAPILTDRVLAGNHHVYGHVVPGRYVSLAYTYTAGAVLRWYRDVFSEAERAEARRTGRDPYDVMLAGVALEPGRLLVLPHFFGAATPYMDPQSKGAVLGLTLDATKRDLLKGVLDGIVYELRVNLESLSSAGLGVRALHAVGGGARSAAWLQMRADATRLPFQAMATEEAGALGGAILGGVASGAFGSVSEGVQRCVRPGRWFEPNAGRAALWDEKFETYRKVYGALREINAAL